MKIEKLRVNNVENPVGFLLDKISLSWIVTEAKGTKTKNAQVEISTDKNFSSILFDSGISADINSLDFVPSLKPCDGVRYYWRVKVLDDTGDYGVSDTAFFETARPLSPAEWITSPFSQKIHPLFRKEFNTDKTVKNARLYICGLGLYEAYINGEKVGDEYLAPFFNDYDNWVQYQTYDITDMLKGGKNVIGIMLGNGWYKGRFGYIDKIDEIYGDTFKLISKIYVEYEDGTTAQVCTDDSWLCAESPVIQSSIYDGEKYDSRKEIKNWADSDCNENLFVKAVMTDAPAGKLTPRLSLPVVIKETIKPKELIYTKSGDTVIDFGQNMTGWVEFDLHLPEGKELFCQFGEVLQNGEFYNDNLRTAKAEFSYISNGKKNHIRPHFTFYGFRYMKISGLEKINPDDIKASVIYSDMQQTGKIETSNPKVNRLILNALWGQKSNFLDVPTDCPQRDERLGWTGDAQVFCATANLNMYTPAFYKKYLYDMLLEQRDMDGAVGHVIPNIFTQIGRKVSKAENSDSSCAWADAATIIPWKVYQSFGSKTLLSGMYENMKMWIDRIHSVDVEKCGESYLRTIGFHFGDWLALDNYKTDSPFGATDVYYIASVYYYYSALLTSKAARVLEKEDEAEYYLNMASKVKSAIQKEYFTNTGRIAVSTQTAMVLALYFDLVPVEFRSRLINDLKNKLKEDNNHLTTGFVGVSYLCPCLSEIGLTDIAYTLLLNEDYPGWLYAVNLGATTIWERWNSLLPDGRISSTGMNSLNHYSYGSIVEWIYRYAAGINVCEDGAGYKHFVIKPYPDKRFEFISAEYDSPMGKIRSCFTKTDVGYEYEVEVPFDTNAEFIITENYDEFKIGDDVFRDVKAGFKVNLTKGKYKISAANKK